MGALTHNGEVLQSLPANASQINFDKTGTNLNSTQTENAIKEVNTKVNTLQSEKADTDIVASDFSTSASYTTGDYCIYEGKFYKFKATHSGAWSVADVDEIKITGELSALKSGLIDSNMVPVNTITLGTIATNENQKSFTVTKNGYVTVDSGNVGATNPTVTCSVYQIAKNYGAATTVTIAAYTGVKFCTVPVKAGDYISVDISGHTVEVSVLQISYS